MIIVWSGWGILVPVFFAVGFALGIPLGHLIPGTAQIQMGATAMFAGLVCGAASFFLARKLESREGRAFPVSTQPRCRVDIPHSSAMSSWLIRRAPRHARSNMPIGG